MTEAGLSPPCSSITAAAIADLRNNLIGHLVLPGDPTYDADRQLYDPLFDAHPCAIIFCVVEEDVRQALSFAIQNKVDFRIRSGGHSTAGFSASDGILIDVSGINDLCVDPFTRTATVGSGCNFRKFQSVLHSYGFHVPMPGGSTVGVAAGFMQGGGWGPTSPIYGMNSDNVVGFRMLLANGRPVYASKDINHDLWWAVRGGTGGNFGVLLNTRYKIHSARRLKSLSATFWLTDEIGRARAARIFTLLQHRYTNPESSNVGMAAGIDWSDGSPYFWLTGNYLGGQRTVENSLRPLMEELDQHIVFSRYHPNSWAEQGPLTKSGDSRPYQDQRSRFFADHLSLSSWASIVDFVIQGGPAAVFQIHCYGGKIKSFPMEGSAFIHRRASVNAYFVASWTDKNTEEKSQILLDAWCSLVEPHWNGHIYQNFPNPKYTNYRKNYWGAAFPTLLAVKEKYDPQGVFCYPQAILPPSDGLPEWPARVVRALRQPVVYG